jgi:hypothetical protein
MTEQEWLDWTDVDWLLAYLSGRGPPDARKVRLLACACCRRLWRGLDAASRSAVETAEDFADGRAGSARLTAARRAVKAARAVGDSGHLAEAVLAAVYDGEVPLHYRIRHGMRACAEAAVEVSRSLGAWAAERTAQADLLRDLFANPFRPPALDPAGLRWQDGLVVRMARAVCEDRRYQDLPVLADALEDAGCTDTVLLDHCRGPGPHARGCWLLDLLLNGGRGP